MLSTILPPFWNGKYHLSLFHDNVSHKLLQGSYDPSLELCVRGCTKGQTASRGSPTLSPRWWCRWLFFFLLGEEKFLCFRHNSWDGFDCIIENINQRQKKAADTQIQPSRFPYCVLLALSWNTNENPSTDKLSRAINKIQTRSDLILTQM